MKMLPASSSILNKVANFACEVTFRIFKVSSRPSKMAPNTDCREKSVRNVDYEQLFCCIPLLFRNLHNHFKETLVHSASIRAFRRYFFTFAIHLL